MKQIDWRALNKGLINEDIIKFTPIIKELLINEESLWINLSKSELTSFLNSSELKKLPISEDIFKEL